MDLVESVYILSADLPDSEKYNFRSQITRSALSIPSNLAEGAGRSTNKDFSRFVDMAIGSCFELETQLLLVHRIFEINTDRIVEEVKEVQKMSCSLRKSLKNDIQKVLST